MSKTPILIAGAGPTGLMLACELTRHKIDFVIVDKKEAPTEHSKALGVHARSMEIYRKLGLAHDILSQSNPIVKFALRLGQVPYADVQLFNIDDSFTEFPYLVIFEQSKNEKILVEYLERHGKRVTWNTEIVDFKESAVCKTKTADGTEIISDYVVACDGAKSFFRKKLELEFLGGTYDSIFYVVDVETNSPIAENALSGYLNVGSFCIQMPLENSLRLVGSLQEGAETDLEAILSAIKQNIPNLEIKKVHWHSTYQVHHRSLEEFHNGSVFFCGDACHVHSPAGAQGMNTGLQDAHALAWRLALVLKKELHPLHLDSYSEERVKVAKTVVNSTDRGFKILASTTQLNFLFKKILFTFVPYLLKIDPLRLRAVKFLSQCGISYRTSSFSGKPGVTTLVPGDRLVFEYIFVDDKRISTHELVKSPDFTLLLFSISETSYNTEFETKIVKLKDNRDFFRKHRIEEDTFVLVRPDDHICYSGPPESFNLYVDFLQNGN